MTAKGRKLDNWILGYSKYTEGTESPPRFHLWVAISTIAAAAQRKIFIDADYFQIHSNLYVILVSPAGRSRKSTALRIGKSLLKGVMDYGIEINFSTQASSVAALVKQLSSINNQDHQSLTSFSSELGSLFGTKPVEMVDFLMDIYDCNPDWDKQTVSRGLEKIDKPWFNLLAATTPVWMGDNLSKTTVEGGFASRSIFVYDDVRLLVAFPSLTAEQKQIRRDLVHDLAHIAQLKGEFKLRPDAREFYRSWYEDPNRMTGHTDQRLASYFERKHINVLKVAMILSLSQNDSLVLETRDIEVALELFADIEPGMHKAFAAVGKNSYSTDYERIKLQIQRTGPRGMSYKEIISSNIYAIDKRTIDEQLNALMNAGEIEAKGKLFVSTNGTYG